MGCSARLKISFELNPVTEDKQGTPLLHFIRLCDFDQKGRSIGQIISTLGKRIIINLYQDLSVVCMLHVVVEFKCPGRGVSEVLVSLIFIGVV